MKTNNTARATKLFDFLFNLIGEKRLEALAYEYGGTLNYLSKLKLSAEERRAIELFTLSERIYVPSPRRFESKKRAKAVVEDRKAGMKFRQIARKHGITEIYAMSLVRNSRQEGAGA